MRDIEDYAQKYVSEPCENYQVLYRRQKVLEIMANYTHENILEIGCGLEPLFPYVDHYKKMFIVEPSRLFVENIARKIVQYNVQDRVSYVEGFFENEVGRIKQSGMTFDYIMVGSLLHELEFPEKFLDAVKEICNENTIVHINVPNAKSIHRLLAKEMGIITDIYELSDLQITMQRKRVFDIDSLSDFVTSGGFEVLESGSYFPKFLTANQMEKILEQGILNDSIFEGLYKLGKFLPEYGSEIYLQLRKRVD